MKILLINPCVDHIIKTELPVFIRSEAGVFPPLGLLYLAAALRKHNQRNDVSILDAVSKKMGPGEIAAVVAGHAPDIVGITAHTHNLLDVALIAKEIKKLKSPIHINIGGPHATQFPYEAALLDGIDSVVFGEGEETFCALVECLSNKRRLREVEGIFFKEGKEVVENKSRLPQNDLDNLAHPDYSMLKGCRYQYPLSRKGRRVVTMIAGRGCPCNCYFCSTPKGPYRERSAGDIVSEIASHLAAGAEEIYFTDDAFGCRREHVLELCAQIKKSGLSFRWSARMRVDNLNEKIIRALKEAGCARIHVGVETSTDEGLRMLNKQITVSQIREVFRITRQADMTTAAYFMLGCPHEKDPQDSRHTIDFAKELDPDYALFNILALYPGTRLYQEAVEKGLVAADHWQAFALSPRKDFKIPFWEEYLSRVTLGALLTQAYRAFYLRPGCISRLLRDPGGVAGLADTLKKGIKIAAGRN